MCLETYSHRTKLEAKASWCQLVFFAFASLFNRCKWTRTLKYRLSKKNYNMWKMLKMMLRALTIFPARTLDLPVTSRLFACFHGYYFLLADVKYNNHSVFTFDASDVTGTHFSYQHGDVITSPGHHIMTTTTTTTAAVATKQSHRNSGKHILPTRSKGCWCVMV